ncbi:MAG: type 4b pilus protein PilO2 [Alphaproteobacteria bacterium]|nr:type 4b pilus protein PilO2 [Alphaproteobacteria bacterium]
MASQVISIERKKYATGLFWQPVSGGHNARGLARSLSKFVPGAVKYFTEYRSMIGIGGRALGHQSRMPSAAAEINDAFSDYNSFLAAFAVRNGFYIVSVRNGVIIQDKLFSDEASAKAEYELLTGLPDWGLLIAPGGWSVPRAEEKILSEVVSGDTKYYLMPIGKFGGAFVSLAMLGALLFGIFYIFREPLTHIINPPAQKVEIDEAARAAYVKKLEERDSALLSAAKTAIPAPAAVVMPYDNIPDISARARMCFDAITFLMQVIPGWTQADAECEDNVAAAHLHRRFGVITEVYEFVANNMPGVEIIENSDSDMVLVLELDEIPGQSRLAEQDADTAIRNINSVFQTMGHDADVRRSIETVQGAGAMAAANIVLVGAASALQPMEFVKIFEDYDAVLLSSVRWSASSKKWNYEVKIYVK